LIHYIDEESMDEKNVVVVGLEGSQKYQRLLGGAPQTCGMKSGHMNLQPGESVGAHVTDGKEEAIVFLQGRGEILVDGKVFSAVTAGQLVYVPPQVNHDIRNIGSELLRYVYVVTPVVR
jgi:mannose-6-phosphate isomerase-like protein (cupin superfamily)